LLLQITSTKYNFFYTAYENSESGSVMLSNLLFEAHIMLNVFKVPV